MGRTSIGFGGGEVIEVGLPLDEVRELLQTALAGRSLVELQAVNGETVIINPEQVKVLQNSGRTILGRPPAAPPRSRFVKPS